MDRYADAFKRSGRRATVLVVEDGEFARQRVKEALRAPNREVFVAGTASEGLAALPDLKPDVIFAGLEVPDLPGVRILDVFQERARGVPIVATTEAPSVHGAVEALRHGAVDYVGRDVDRSKFLEVVIRAMQEARSDGMLRHAQQQVRDRYGFQRLVSQSPVMLRVFDQVRAVAQTDATVLILGETGTGKELVSRAVHDRSRRSEQPFIAVNCGAFTETLLESELFGHEKGSFTGAQGRREGLFEMGDGGTLFLDELGETTLNVQVNLLRVLETMTFRRVGGREEVQVDVRIVAATNVELEESVAKGTFREDLYYRLNVFPIEIPPLRKRREDIPLLMRHFLDEGAEEYDVEPPVIAAEAMDAILGYQWPGNVRQLRAMCERWVITRAGQRLEREHLPPTMTGKARATPDAGSFAIDEATSMKDNTASAVAQIERAYLYKQLKRFRGHLEKTADASGITRRTLYTKMKAYGLDARDFK